MRQLIWALLAFCVAVAGCQDSQPAKPAARPVAKAKMREQSGDSVKPHEALPGARSAVGSGDFLIAEPLQYKNLTVFPILSKTAKNDDRFITLDEGFKTQRVEVMEVGARPVNRPADQVANDPFGDAPNDPFADDHDVAAVNRPPRSSQQASSESVQNYGDSLAIDGDVNHLLVMNKSDKPLYLMPGEIIVGGKQDRCIAAETIVEADGKPVSIEVYCVEHGRWHRRNMEDFAALASVLVEDFDGGNLAGLNQQAAAGKFVASAGNLSKKARYSAQAGIGQQQVWDDVGMINNVNGAISESGAFTQNYAQQDVRERLDPYLKRLERPVSDLDRAVGVIVAINGQVEMADVYESTPLFRKLWPKLLKGYALDAIAVAEEKEASKVCAAADAKAFLDKAREASVEKTRVQGGLTVTSRSSKGVTSFSADMEGGIGGFGAGIHGAAY